MQQRKWTWATVPIIILCLAWSWAPNGKVNWIDIQEADSLYVNAPRPVLIDVYTDWCGWCKIMDKSTYKDKRVADYINAHYYAIKFNAEFKKPVKFNNTIYKYDPENKVHELAVYLTHGQLEFPNTIFLSSVSAIPAPIAGYMKPSEIEAPLKYFGEKKEKVQTLSAFEYSMQRAW